MARTKRVMFVNPLAIIAAMILCSVTSYGDDVQIDEVADVTIYGAKAGDKAGEAFATGDFNGDGWIDLAVSCAGDHNGSGSISILWGNNPLDSIVDLGTATNVSWVLCRSEYTGTLLSLVSGDFNNDSIDDLSIGTPQKAGDSRGYVLRLRYSLCYCYH